MKRRDDAFLDELDRLYRALRALWRDALMDPLGTSLPFDAWVEMASVRHGQRTRDHDVAATPGEPGGQE